MKSRPAKSALAITYTDAPPPVVKPKPAAPAAVVIFRTFKRADGETIALFPCEPFDRHGFYCVSYQHTGQHGGAMPSLTSSAATRPATRAEARTLAAELRRAGYRLDIRRRRTQAHDAARRATAIANFRAALHTATL